MRGSELLKIWGFISMGEGLSQPLNFVSLKLTQVVSFSLAELSALAIIAAAPFSFQL